MWLEEWAWFWLPLVGGLMFWLVKSHLGLRAEVHALRMRIEEIEACNTMPNSKRQQIA